ncbi:MAG: hypothetical protein HY398_02265 [Candidatus Doudnabacteria bacterium]|nr:hypothetical protein [Candidatus Doudnabacteria bacterium]
MENESFDPDKEKIELPSADSSDMELAFFLMRHIDNPCETELYSGQRVNIRKFYIDLAEESLSKLTNPDAKLLLESKVGEYKSET